MTSLKKQPSEKKKYNSEVQQSKKKGADIYVHSKCSRFDPTYLVIYPVKHDYVIVIARVLGIYGSKPTRVRGRSPWTRAVYVAINP